jgi:hypothetical protein
MTTAIFLLEGNINILKIKNDMTTYDACKLYALNYESHKILTENDLKHEIAENFLSNEDRIKIDDDSIRITINWYNNPAIKELITFEEINLGSLIEMELLQYFVKIYGNAAMINKIIEKESPTHIVSYTSLNDYIERICKQKNIHIISNTLLQLLSLQSDKVNIKYNLGSYPISITISNKSFMKIRKIFDKTVNLFFKLKPNLKLIRNKKSILLLDFNTVQYDLLIKELSSLNKNIILLNQRRPVIWNLQSFKIIKNSNCKIIHLNDFGKNIGKKISLEVKTLESNLEKLWNRNSTFEEIFSTDFNTFWYAIKESFTKVCTSRFRESVRRILLVNVLFDTLDISVILEWAETGQEEKEIIYLSKKRGIKSILLQHAMDPLSHVWDKYHRFALGGYSYFISDKQALWGPQVKNRALSYGHKEENLIVTGSPRHDNFFKSVDMEEKNGVILFATTAVTGRISFEQTPLEAYVNFDNFVKEVCRVAKKFPDKQLIVKPHPQPDFLSNITKIIKEIDPSIPILYNASLIELINSCDLLITFNNSTVILESMILGKPAISLQIEKWAQEDDIVKTGAFLSISNIDEIENSMKKILYDNEFKNNLLENSKNFVNNYFANSGNASHELAKLLDSF